MKTFAPVVVVAFAFASTLLFSGCAGGHSRLMIHPQTGKTVDCSTSGFGTLGSTSYLVMEADCENRYRQLGFVALKEYREMKSKNEKGK